VHRGTASATNHIELAIKRKLQATTVLASQIGTRDSSGGFVDKLHASRTEII
jgi:hypothetical protein